MNYILQSINHCERMSLDSIQSTISIIGIITKS